MPLVLNEGKIILLANLPNMAGARLGDCLATDASPREPHVHERPDEFARLSYAEILSLLGVAGPEA